MREWLGGHLTTSQGQHATLSPFPTYELVSLKIQSFTMGCRSHVLKLSLTGTVTQLIGVPSHPVDEGRGDLF